MGRMKDENIQTIYRNFAEFHLRGHVRELKNTYLFKSLRLADPISTGLKTHTRIFQDELSERLDELSKNNMLAYKDLVAIKEEYLRKLRSKIPSE
jgi:hypothetical protein